MVMSWYYLNESGEVVGPVSEQALKELNVAGSLTEASLVCREGTEDWIGLAEALGTRPSPSVGGESFKFNCPHCDQQIAAEPAQIGVSLQCPACGGGTVVPSTGEAVARPQETPLLDAPRVGDSQYGDSKKPDHQPESSEPAESASSFADRLQTGATAGWSAVKRHSNQAALIAQIEKLRNVDLRMAHYELGKKCFESEILESELEEEFQAVRELDAKIAEKREKLETEADETRIDALKRIGKDAAKVSHAQALTLKRQHLLTHLGQSAFSRRENEDLSGLEAEIAAIEEIERNIRSKEEEEALIPGAGAVHSFADRLKTGAKEGWADIERTSKAAAIHTQIEKIRNVDLRMALFALGKKCYEAGILQEDLQKQFQQIRDLDATIASKQEAGETVDAETKIDSLKRMGKDAANSSHAQALTVKRQHLVTELGRQAHAIMREECRPGLEAEIAAIEEIEGSILGQEEEVRILGTGHAKGWRNRIPAIAVAAALILLLLAGGFSGLRMIGVGKNDDFVTPKSEENQQKANLIAYYNSIGFSDSEAEAILRYFTKKLEPAEAMSTLGACYEGHDMWDPDKVMYWHYKAAEAGSGDAMYRLAVILHPDFTLAFRGYPKGNSRESHRWVREAAEHGNPEGMNAMGNDCWFGVIDNDRTNLLIEPNRREAVKWWEKAAKAGSSDAKEALIEHKEEISAIE